MTLRAFNQMKSTHSLAIARYMMQFAQERLLDDELGKEMFILGLLHDIGDEFSSDKKEHGVIGGLALKAQNYKYWKEVYHHGDPNTTYDSLALRLLNLAELSHTAEGEYVGVEKRLERLKEKFGDESPEYRNSTRLARKIQNDEIKY